MSEVLNNFKRDGFYIAESLLEIEIIDRLINSINSTIIKQLNIINVKVNNGLEENLKLLFKQDLQRYKKTLSALWRQIEVYNVTHHKKIQNFVRDNFNWDEIIIPGGQVLHIQSKSLKIPNGYFGLIPHQDFPSVQGSLNGMVVWIPLMDIDETNYPLEVIVGSHKNGIWESVENKDSTWEINPILIKNQEFKKVIVKKGDVVFMSNFTVHRSGIEGDFEKVRIACSTRYDDMNEISFIERVFPTAYKRSVIREQIHEIDLDRLKNIF